MNKFFQALTKPAKWVLVIGGFFYAIWFAIMQGTAIDGEAMSVIAHLVIMIVGTILLVAVPVLVLLKKDDAAKMLFLFLIGYWVLTSIQNWLFYAETFTDSDNGLGITAGIFSFIAGLGLVGVLVMTVLEFALKKPAFRVITLLIMLGVLAVSFIAGLLLFIYACTINAVWPMGLNFLVEYIILPVIICFGYLYFFGVPEKKQVK